MFLGWFTYCLQLLYLSLLCCRLLHKQVSSSCWALLKHLSGICQAVIRQLQTSPDAVARLLQGSRNAVAKQSQGSHELGSWKYSIYLNKRLIIVKQSFKLSLQYEIMYVSFIVSPTGLKVFSVLFQSIFLAYLSLQSTKNISEWLTVGKFFSFFGIVWLPVIGVFTWKNNNRNITENNRRMTKMKKNRKTRKLERDFYLKAQYSKFSI